MKILDFWICLRECVTESKKAKSEKRANAKCVKLGGSDLINTKRKQKPCNEEFKIRTYGSVVKAGEIPDHDEFDHLGICYDKAWFSCEGQHGENLAVPLTIHVKQQVQLAFHFYGV